MKTCRVALLLATVLSLPIHADQSSGGPLSEYFLSAGFHGKLFGVQGLNLVLDVAAGPGNEYPIAVMGTVRTMGHEFGEAGREYTLAGIPSGASYPNTVANSQFYDGTTDGIYNYAWDLVRGAVYRFGLDWSSPTVLFTLGRADGSRLGITYDETNQSLWISGFTGSVGTTVSDYAMDGTLISSFTVAHDRITALAMDHSDHTLWMGFQDYGPNYSQYGKTGALLGSVSYPSLNSYSTGIVGGEFQLPEPGTPLLMIAGLAALAGGRDRR